MKDYKIFKGTATQCQTVLNQWKNKYELNVIDVHYEEKVGSDDIIMVIERKELVV